MGFLSYISVVLFFILVAWLALRGSAYYSRRHVEPEKVDIFDKAVNWGGIGATVGAALATPVGGVTVAGGALIGAGIGFGAGLIYGLYRSRKKQ